MRALLITSLCCISILSGCKLYRTVHSDTPEISAADLAVKHVYKVPQKKRHLARFNDPQLHQLISIALVDAPDMRSARARVISARQIAKGAYSALWPSADLSGYLARDHFSFNGTVPPPLNEIVATRLSIKDIALNFNYELDFWGKNRETLASRLNEAFAARMDLEETRLILSSAVASAYFELQNVIAQQQLAKENARLLKEMEDIILDRAKQGIESDIPLKTAITNTQAALLSVEDYKRNEMQARHQLAVLLGKNPANTQIDTTKFSYNKKQLALPTVIPANVLAQRPDIASSRALAESAAHQINVARAAFFPNLNLSGVLSMQSFYFSQFFNVSLKTEGIKGALELPIFDAGKRRANLGVKQANFELAVNQYNQTILNALKEVTDQMTALKTLNQQVQDQTSALTATETNYKLFKSRYAQGIIDYVQLIEIKQVLIQQKATLYSLQTRQKQSFVALLAALGGEVQK